MYMHTHKYQHQQPFVALVLTMPIVAMVPKIPFVPLSGMERASLPLLFIFVTMTRFTKP